MTSSSLRTRPLITSALAAMTGLTLAMGAGCGNGSKVNAPSSAVQAASSGGGNNSNLPASCSVPAVPCTGAPLCITAPAVSMNLGDAKTVSVIVTAASNFATNRADITIEKTEIDSINSYGLSIVPSVSYFSLGANCTKNLTLDIRTRSFAPILSAAGGDHFHVRATDYYSASNGEGAVPFTINPIFEAGVYGNIGMSEEKWGDRVGRVNLFRNPAAAGGKITLNFTNYDTVNRNIIHGTGAINHQNTATSNAPSPGAGMPGGIYMAQLAANASGSAYIHGNQASTGGENPTYATRNYQTVPVSGILPTFANTVSQIAISCKDCHKVGGANAGSSTLFDSAGNPDKTQWMNQIDTIISVVSIPAGTAGVMPPAYGTGSPVSRSQHLSTVDIEDLYAWKAFGFL